MTTTQLQFVDAFKAYNETPCKHIIRKVWPANTFVATVIFDTGQYMIRITRDSQSTPVDVQMLTAVDFKALDWEIQGLHPQPALDLTGDLRERVFMWEDILGVPNVKSIAERFGMLKLS